MKNIEVGDYVRTKSGEIGIFVEYRDDKFFCKIKIKNTYYTPPISTITKHSKNIIDLIEVGDFVNGYRIDLIDSWGVLVHEARGINKSGFSIPVAQYEEDIETILTKEQYSQNCYTVERR